MEIELFQHQVDVINRVWGKYKNIGLFMDLGLGKTTTSTVLALLLDNPKTLIICPKSLIQSWKDNFNKLFPEVKYEDLTKTKNYENFEGFGIVNYEMAVRKPELLKLKDYTLILDESSKICHDNTKRTKFIMKLKPENTILLSGSPCGGGHYENFYTQAKLLGVKMNKTKWWDAFVKWHFSDFSAGYRFKIVDGYKHTDEMIEMLTRYGAVFMKADDVISLPDTIEKVINIPKTISYMKFLNNKIVTIGEEEFVGDNPLSLRLYARMLCAHHNNAKLERLENMLADTDDRVVVFYSFKKDYELIKNICEKLEKPISVVNGDEKDLTNYDARDNCVVLCQMQSASYGLNLQRANKIIYFSLGESADAFIQSKGRIRRIGQNRTCWYYYLVCEDTVEEDIYNSVQNGMDYNDTLFQKYLEKLKA